MSIALVEFDDEIPVLFMTVGLVGSGKTECASEIEVKRNGILSKPRIHSSDSIREELFEDVNDQTHNTYVFSVLQNRVKDDLRNGIDTIYDATNINKKRRTAFLQELKNIPCHKVCVLMLTPYEMCINQNNSRERVVPEEVIKRMYLSFCPPSYDEGFDYIALIYNYGSVGKDKYTLENFFEGEVNANAINQENSHHKSTIGVHCQKAADYIVERYPENDVLRTAALLHDIGKPFTKSKLNYHGEEDGNCHYYNHQNCGSYDSFFYTDVLGLSHNQKIHIANLIYYHMHPFLSWMHSKRAEDRDRVRVGEDMFHEIKKLHKADLAAH